MPEDLTGMNFIDQIRSVWYDVYKSFMSFPGYGTSKYNKEK
jgi:hypothetical protein